MMTQIIIITIIIIQSICNMSCKSRLRVWMEPFIDLMAGLYRLIAA